MNARKKRKRMNRNRNAPYGGYQQQQGNDSSTSANYTTSTFQSNKSDGNYYTGGGDGNYYGGDTDYYNQGDSSYSRGNWGRGNFNDGGREDPYAILLREYEDEFLEFLQMKRMSRQYGGRYAQRSTFMPDYMQDYIERQRRRREGRDGGNSRNRDAPPGGWRKTRREMKKAENAKKLPINYSYGQTQTHYGQSTEIPAPFYCFFCEIDCLSLEVHQVHMKTPEHIKAEEVRKAKIKEEIKIMNIAAMKKVLAATDGKPTNAKTCNCCLLTFTEEYDEHCKSIEHEMMQTFTLPVHCHFCSASLNDRWDFEKHQTTAEHAINVRKRAALDLQFGDDAVCGTNVVVPRLILYCKVCDTLFPKGLRARHSNLQTHVRNYREFRAERRKHYQMEQKAVAEANGGMPKDDLPPGDEKYGEEEEEAAPQNEETKKEGDDVEMPEEELKGE